MTSLPSFHLLHTLSLEKEMATHSNILAWKTPWTEEPGRLQSMGSQGVGHDCQTSLPSLTSYFITGEGNGNPLQYSCLENPMDRGAWRAMVHGVAESQRSMKQRLFHSPSPEHQGVQPLNESLDIVRPLGYFWGLPRWR